ncbi:MAG: SsrA-binding protein SmpB [Buchnera aphidicola (Schlechtendalia peitan)]
MNIKYNSSNLNITVAFNKKVKHRYFIEDTLEAGLVLLGWEVKAFKSGNINIIDSYVSFYLGEVYLIDSQFSSLYTNNIHISYDSNRKRKILLKKYEIIFLYNKIYKNNYTAVALEFFLKNNWCKTKIAIVKGKTQYDKREIERKNKWKLEKNRIMKSKSLS